MTYRMIQHDFRKNASVAPVAEETSNVSLTAALLKKGRNLAAVNHGLNMTCLALCGACIGVSVWILASLVLG